MAGRRIASSVVSLVMFLGLLISIQVTPVGSASADDDPPPVPPSSVSLVADALTFAAGGSVALTATTDVEVSSSGSRIEIVEEATGSVLSACSSGTSCTAQVSFASGPARSYIARSAGVVSSSVSISLPWSVGLTQNKAVFAAGEQVTLTATANQNVGSTGGNYKIFIRDVTSDTILNWCSAGDTCTVDTSFYTGGPHEY